MLGKKSFFALVLVCLINFSGYTQDDDIFGITRKAKNPKSESGTGNVLRSGIELLSLELSAGGAYQQLETTFFSENPSLFPINKYQNLNSSTFSSSDTLVMWGRDWIKPLINAGIRINLFDLLTIGGGFGQEWGNLPALRGNDHEFKFDGSGYQLRKLYGTVGLVLFDAKRRQSILKWQYRKYSSNNLYMQSELRQRARQNYPWKFILEGEFGNLKLTNIKNFASDNAVNGNTSKLSASPDPYLGAWLRIEYNFSDYVKVFMKGGGEVRKYTYAASDFSGLQTIDQNIYGLQTGFSMQFPGTKRCKIQGCGVVMKHPHRGVEYRGSSIFRFQNRKIGQWY